MTNRNNLDNEWYSLDSLHNIKIGEHVYYAQTFPTQGTYEVLELNVARIRSNDIESYFVGTETRDKHSYLFSFSDVGKTVFQDKQECLKVVQSIEQEHKGEKISEEKYYEED